MVFFTKTFQYFFFQTNQINKFMVLVKISIKKKLTHSYHALIYFLLHRTVFQGQINKFFFFSYYRLENYIVTVLRIQHFEGNYIFYFED